MTSVPAAHSIINPACAVLPETSHLRPDRGHHARADIRFVVTSLATGSAEHVYERIPKAHALATAEFATLRLRLLKLGSRVIETASRVRLAFAAACPDARLIHHLAAGLMPAAP